MTVTEISTFFITTFSRGADYEHIYYLCWPVEETGTSPTKQKFFVFCNAAFGEFPGMVHPKMAKN